MCQGVQRTARTFKQKFQDQQDQNEKKFQDFQILVQTLEERHKNDANELREQQHTFKQKFQEQQVLLDQNENKFQEFQILVQTLKETHKDELREQKFQAQHEVKIQEILVHIEMKHKDVAKEFKEQQKTFKRKFQDQQALLDQNEKKFQTLENRQLKFEVEMKTVEKKFQASFETIDQQIALLQTAEISYEAGTIITWEMGTVTTEKNISIDFTDYEEHKKEKTSISRQLKTDEKDGHNYSLTLYPNGTEEETDSHLSLKIFPDPDYKNQSDYPSRIIITIELRNQYKDKNHVTRVITYKSPDYIKMESRSRSPEQDISDIKFISLADLDRQTEYLKDGCLKFRVVKQEITEPIYAWRKKKLERLMVQT